MRLQYNLTLNLINVDGLQPAIDRCHQFKSQEMLSVIGIHEII